MREADHLEPPESVLAAAIERTSRQAKWGLSVGIPQADSVGKVGLDRQRFVASSLVEAYGHGQESRWAGNTGH